VRAVIFLITRDAASTRVVAGDVPVVKIVVKALQGRSECGGGEKREKQSFHGFSFG